MPGVKLKAKSPVGTGQKSLLSFFSPQNNSQKQEQIEMATPSRKASEDYTSDKEKLSLSPQPKKLKLDSSAGDENDSEKGSPECPLTPDQKKLVQNKAIAAKLLRESQTLKLLDPQMGTSWFPALEPEFKKEYFKELNDFVTSKRGQATVFPPPQNVWEWTKQTPIRDIKVVILGQDPYHGPRQAHGLCFSVQKGVPPPPSLVNIYKELKSDIANFNIPNHGDLTGWAKQGVLLLNAVLTVESGKANAHKDKGWEKITDAVIAWISKNLNNVVFLLWGAYAQKKAAFVDKKKHHLLQAVHPSPLSAHRGFLGCKHFSKCNDLLEKSGKAVIDWNDLP